MADPNGPSLAGALFWLEVRKEKWRKRFYSVKGTKVAAYEDAKMKRKIAGSEFDVSKMKDPYDVTEANAKNEDHLFAFQIIFNKEKEDIIYLGASTPKGRDQWIDHLQRIIRGRQPKNMLMQLREKLMEEPQGEDQMEEHDVEKIVDQTVAKGLDELDLSELGLTDIPRLLKVSQKSISDRLPRIPIVDLSMNNFVDIPSDVFHLRYIVELSVAQCKIEKFPVELRKLRKLADLNMSGNKLQVLPEEIGYLTGLEKLNVSNNNLTYVHDSLGNCRRMEELNMSGNPRLRSLPGTIGDLRNLLHLNVNSCMFQKFPHELGFCDRLIEIECANNQLEELPSEMGRLTRLSSLNAAENKLFCLPASMGLCINLGNTNKLDLHNNPFQDPSIISAYKQSVQHLLQYLEELMVRFGGFPKYESVPILAPRPLPPYQDTFQYTEEDNVGKKGKGGKSTPSGIKASHPEQHHSNPNVNANVNANNNNNNPNDPYKRSLRERKRTLRSLTQDFEELPDELPSAQQNHIDERNLQQLRELDRLEQQKAEEAKVEKIGFLDKKQLNNNLVQTSNYQRANELNALIKNLPSSYAPRASSSPSVPPKIAHPPARGSPHQQHHPQQQAAQNLDMLSSMIDHYSGGIQQQQLGRTSNPGLTPTDKRVHQMKASNSGPTNASGSNPGSRRGSSSAPSRHKPAPEEAPPPDSSLPPPDFNDMLDFVPADVGGGGGGGGGGIPADVPPAVAPTPTPPPAAEPVPTLNVSAEPHRDSPRVPRRKKSEPPLPQDVAPRANTPPPASTTAPPPSSSAPSSAPSSSSSSSTDTTVMVSWADTTLEVLQFRISSILGKLNAIESPHELVPYVNKLKEIKGELAQVNKFVAVRNTQPPPSDNKFERAKSIAQAGLTDLTEAMVSLQGFVKKAPAEKLQAAVPIIQKIKDIVETPW